jgi:hypothetical protein
MNFKSQILLAIILAAGLALLTVAGCARNPSSSSAQKASLPTPSPSPKLITTADLVKLRWIEGSWRGTGDGQWTFRQER